MIGPRGLAAVDHGRQGLLQAVAGVVACTAGAVAWGAVELVPVAGF
ncbi:hypothetical protein [Dactylosporangium sp. NPDC048998]